MYEPHLTPEHIQQCRIVDDELGEDNRRQRAVADIRVKLLALRDLALETKDRFDAALADFEEAKARLAIILAR